MGNLELVLIAIIGIVGLLVCLASVQVAFFCNRPAIKLSSMAVALVALAIYVVVIYILFVNVRHLS